MDDRQKWNYNNGNRHEQSNGVPVAVICNEALEDELWRAITDSATSDSFEDGNFEEIEEELGEEIECLDHDEERALLLRLLAPLRPRLAELLGGPSAD